MAAIPVTAIRTTTNQPTKVIHGRLTHSPMIFLLLLILTIGTSTIGATTRPSGIAAAKVAVVPGCECGFPLRRTAAKPIRVHKPGEYERPEHRAVHPDSRSK